MLYVCVCMLRCDMLINLNFRLSGGQVCNAIINLMMQKKNLDDDPNYVCVLADPWYRKPRSQWTATDGK